MVDFALLKAKVAIIQKNVNLFAKQIKQMLHLSLVPLFTDSEQVLLLPTLNMFFSATRFIILTPGVTKHFCAHK